MVIARRKMITDSTSLSCIMFRIRCCRFLSHIKGFRSHNEQIPCSFKYSMIPKIAHKCIPWIIINCNGVPRAKSVGQLLAFQPSPRFHCWFLCTLLPTSSLTYYFFTVIIIWKQNPTKHTAYVQISFRWSRFASPSLAAVSLCIIVI